MVIMSKFKSAMIQRSRSFLPHGDQENNPPLDPSPIRLYTESERPARRLLAREATPFSLSQTLEKITMKSIKEKSRKGRWIDVTIERDPAEEELKPRGARPRYFINYQPCDSINYNRDGLCSLTDIEIRVVKLNDEAETVIETAYSNFCLCILPRWLRYINRDHRRSPNLFSLSYYTTVAGDTWLYDGRPKFKNPIHTISLCAGGTHCIVFEVRDVNAKHFRSKILDDTVPLKRLLEDRRLTVVGIGMEKFAKKAKEELGIDRLANPRELKSLVDEAFGKNKLGPRVNPEVEEMAELVLDGMKNVRKKNKKVKDMDWGREDVTEDALMYATRDAYFAFEIGKKCLDLIERKGSKSS